MKIAEIAKKNVFLSYYLIFSEKILIVCFLGLFLQRNTKRNRAIILFIMSKIDKKNVRQKELFGLIQKKIPKNQSLVDVISDLLGIGEDAAYRRMKGSKLLDFEEIVKLCEHFHLSLDSVVGAPDQQILFDIGPMDIKDLNSYSMYARDLSDYFDILKTTSKSEIILTAADIPAFTFLSYRELTFFQLFSWNRSVCGFTGSYNDFVEKLNIDELFKYYRNISKNYELIPSTEIWTTNTIDSLLRLLNYHYDMKHFNDEKTPRVLCDQLLELIATTQSWSESGTKGANNTPYNLYISELDIGNTFILFKNAEKCNCMVRLFTNNGLSTKDESFCQLIEDWVRSLSKRSTLISGASEKERHKFFADQRQKIEIFLDKI